MGWAWQDVYKRQVIQKAVFCQFDTVATLAGKFQDAVLKPLHGVTDGISRDISGAGGCRRAGIGGKIGLTQNDFYLLQADL